ncbi:hypothetical protein [Rhodopila globiformis]|uniref:hypothetical protein n=1 Tax=Rhodopila globiformis TaxID=1071 RepID=UPI0011B051EF|nr:hypothetical protein [Rhodopila globiformis]
MKNASSTAGNPLIDTTSHTQPAMSMPIGAGVWRRGLAVHDVASEHDNDAGSWRDDFHRAYSVALDDATISNTVTTSVTLGIAWYSSPLTITPPSAGAGATALVVPASVIDAIVVNQGRIDGAASLGSVSGIGADGGMGVQLSSPCPLTNSSIILGGSAGPGLPVPPRGLAPGGRRCRRG